ncbi:MAG: tetratricopeptide (TPR) repeat protein [Bacillariaceae sp.]
MRGKEIFTEIESRVRKFHNKMVDSDDDDDDDVGTQRFNIGDNLRHKAFYAESIDELRQALHLQEIKSGSNSPDVALTHYSLGLAYRATKDYKQAMKHLNTAVDIYVSSSQKQKGKGKVDDDEDGKDDKFGAEIKDCKLNLARTHHSRGVSYQRAGQYDDSILEHRKAIAIRETILGRSHLETARSHYVMGCALSDRGDFDESLAELRKALRARILVFGGTAHLDVVEVIENIGTVLTARGNINVQSIIEYKMIVIRSLEYETEGDIMCRKGEFDDAMIYYRKAISLEMQYLGDLHPTTCDIYLRMAVSIQ